MWYHVGVLQLLGMLSLRVILHGAAPPLLTVPMAGGEAHSLAVAPDGTVWEWGGDPRYSAYSYKVQPNPVQVPGMDDAVAVSGGYGYSLALKRDGTVWRWNFGETPRKVLRLDDMIAVAAGSFSASVWDDYNGPIQSAALRRDGTVWMWLEEAGPTQVPGLEQIVAITAGFDHFLALKTDGTVWAWGSNTCGQLGNSNAGWGVSTDWAGSKVEGLGDVVGIAAGGGSHFFTFGHSLALKSDGTVWYWGCEGRAEINSTPAKVSGFTEVEAIAGGGEGNIVALKKDGAILDGTVSGRLGGAELSEVVAVAAGASQVLALRGDGTLWSRGHGGPALAQVTGLPRLSLLPSRLALPVEERSRPRIDFHPIAAGCGHSLALAPDGTVWAWGWNEHGQLGDGTIENRTTPVRVSGLGGISAVAAGCAHSLALASDGTVWAWGLYRPTPERIDALTNIAAIAAGCEESLALNRDGTVWQWPGYGLRQDPSRVTGMTDVVAVAVGGGGGWVSDHALAVKADGTVWTWGDGDEPIAGAVPFQVPHLTGAVAVGAGMYDSAALKSDGTVQQWGYITIRDVNALSDVAAIATGADHILALKANGEVWGTGCNGCVWTKDGTFLYESMYGPVPAPVAGLTGVAAIATSYSHGLALKQDGTVWAWGSNEHGGLGDGTTTNRLTPVQVTGLPLLAPQLGAVVNAASFKPGPVAPGELVSIFGVGLGPVEGAVGTAPFPNSLSHARVLFDGLEAALMFAQAGQVSAIVPSTIAGTLSTSVAVEYSGVSSKPLPVDVADSAPGVFSLNQTGAGQALLLNEDGALNSEAKPARKGSVVTVFVTGQGQTDQAPVPKPLLPLRAQIGGQEVEVLDSGCTAGLSGVLQVRARVPETAPTGAAVPIAVIVGGSRSQEGVTIAIQ